ncbi:hypothetical protein [Mycobacteroides chelonae]|nr:hypothetical protein [Mycobacteroides chelonae]
MELVELERAHWTPPPWKAQVLADDEEFRRLARLHLLRQHRCLDDDEINQMLYLQELGFILKDNFDRWLNSND